jgi:2,3-bisphosphoglycerate-dependent phosphoglycerate mutase
MPDDDLTQLILVRHGESDVNVQRVLGGEVSCTGLSDLGRRQAMALRDRWAAGDSPVADVLYSSPLPRALETAEIINPALGDLPIQIEKDLEELRPGQADGMKFAEMQEQFGPIEYRSRPDKSMVLDVETRLAFFYRTSRALEKVIAAHVGETVVIACHGGVIDIAFRHLLDLAPQGMFDLSTINTSLTEFRVHDVDHKRGRWCLVRYNDHAHLDGLPAETAPD